METSAFIEALTETLLISTAQAFAIVLFFRVMFSAVPEIPSAIKYRLWYSSLVLVFGLFIYTLSAMYGQKIHIDLRTEVFSAVQDEQHPISWVEKLELWKHKYASFIGSCYFAGVGIQFLSLLFAWLKARSLGKSEPLLEDPTWLTRLTNLSNNLQIAKNVTLHVSERISVPVTAGFLKPIILLPIATVARLSPEQVESILLHELAHIKRNDYLWNIGQKVMESILFFNPFVWLIAKEIHKEREYCCDEIVVSKTSDPLTYARAFLQLQVQVKHNELAMAASGDEKYPLLDRIKRISGMRNPDPAPKTGLIVLATILCVGLSLAVALPQDTAETVYLKEEVLVRNQTTTVVSSEIKTQEETTINNEGRPVMTRSIMKAPAKKDSVCFEDLALEQHQRQAMEHARVARQHAMLNVKHQEAIKKHAQELKKHFESKEWKQMQKELAEHGEVIAQAAIAGEDFKDFPPVPPLPSEVSKNHQKLQERIEKLQRKFESPEWQEKQMKTYREVINSIKNITSRKHKNSGSKDLEIQVDIPDDIAEVAPPAY